MHLMRVSRKASSGDTAFRPPIRRQLRLARKGNLHAYRLLAAPYFNLVTEYLFFCNWNRDEILRQAELVFRETWKRLPYLNRLSDWEQLLATTLVQVVQAPDRPSPIERPGRLAYLDPKDKLAIIAFDLENWSYYWLGLALRKRPDEVGETLLRARCEILGFEAGREDRPVRRLLRQVSEDIDGQICGRKRSQIQQRLARNPVARDFKCRWLEVRCSLVETRQDVRFSPEERRVFLGALENLSKEEMMRPPLTARARNLVSFAGAPPAEIVPVRVRSLQNAG